MNTQNMRCHVIKIGLHKYTSSKSSSNFAICVYMVIQQLYHSESINNDIAIWLTRRWSDHYCKHIEHKQTYRRKFAIKL